VSVAHMKAFIFVIIHAMLTVNKARFMQVLLVVVGVNFLAQVPYYYHQYYSTRKLLPSLVGVILMSFVLGWFVLGYSRLQRSKRLGYSLMLSFLIVEFLFYLQTQIVQAFSGRGILLHVIHPDDALLFVVFLIGYLNFIAAGWFVYFMIKHRPVFDDTKASE
jgi:hypothetical protein